MNNKRHIKRVNLPVFSAAVSKWQSGIRTAAEHALVINGPVVFGSRWKGGVHRASLIAMLVYTYKEIVLK